MDEVEIKIPEKTQARHSKRFGILILVVSFVFAAVMIVWALSISEEISRQSTKSEEAENVVCKEDKESPHIIMVGDVEATITEGDKYEDKGASASDNCTEDIEVRTTSNVKNDKAGEYLVTYEAEDKTGNKSSLSRKVIVKKKPEEKKKEEKKKSSNAAIPTTNLKGSKIVYLTFDDGPGPYTADLLNVLKKYNVKATFFVTCNDGNKYASMIKREHEEGHTVALHTCSHNYSQVYKSESAYFDDLNKISDIVKKQTGGYESKLVRFPGGSSNTVSRKYNKGIMTRLSKSLAEKGYVYFDWNVSSGDAGGTTTTDGVYNNVVRNLKSGASVVLQHDIKKYSVYAVERIIQFGLKYGFTFRALDASSPGMHHRINN